MLWLTLCIALVAAASAGTLLFYADRRRGVPYPLLTASLRGLLVFLTLYLLLAPEIRTRDTHTEKPIILLLQDNSTSVGTALNPAAAAYQKEFSQLSARLRDQYQVITWNLKGPVTADSLFRYNLPSTDIAAALNEAMSQYGQQNLGAVILATDGQYNQGANPEYTTLPVNTHLYTIALGDTSRPLDLRISKVYANRSVALNSQFEIRADITALGCAGYSNNVTLRDGAGNIVGTTPVSVNNDRFGGSVSFAVTAARAGLQQYTLSVPAAAGEVNTANNKASLFIEVAERKKKILLMAAAPHPDLQAITAALEGMEQYELTVQVAATLPANLQDYACIILHNLPATGQDMNHQLQQATKSTWYIAGAQTNYNSLNQLQQAVRFSIGANTMRDAVPEFRSGFSLFSLPADLSAVSDRLPPLSVVNGDIRAAATANPLFQQAGGQALWTLMPGKTPVAVLCGEGLWRWRLYEFKTFSKHNSIDECIRQTIGFLTSGNNDKPFRTEMASYIWHYPEQVQLSAYLYNGNNEPVNQPEASLRISDSAGHNQDFSFERNGSAYRLSTGTLLPGRYHYTAQTSYNGKKYTDEGNFLVDESSPEVQETGCNYPLLYRLSQRNNGSTFMPGNIAALYDSIRRNNNIRPLLTETIHTAPLIGRKWFFFLILLVAAIEWLLRKYWMAM